MKITTDSLTHTHTRTQYSKDYIHMNACISESDCVWINSTWQRLSASSEAVDLVIKKYMLELFSF